MHSSLTIANRFIGLSASKKTTRTPMLTPLKLLKLVYIAHGWMLGLYGRPLIVDRVEAWKYGPVIPDLYHVIKHYRDQPIESPFPALQGDSLDKTENALVRRVHTVYGKYDGVTLSAMTHQPGTPWERVYKPGKSNIPIPNDMIESYYRKRADDA